MLVKIRSMKEPCPLKQVFPLNKFIKFIKKSLMALSRGLALKSPIITKLSYVLEKKSIIPVKDSRNFESESKGGLYIDITNIFLFSDSTQKIRFVL